MSELNLADIPDLSGIGETATENQPWVDGWYKGTIVAKREFTDSQGNDRVFESTDDPAQRSGRNIRLQVQLGRQDGKTMNISTLINYLPDDLTQEIVQKVMAQREKVQAGQEEWGSLFRSFMTLNRLSKLQKIAGVRSFERNGNGGLNLAPLFGKVAYFRIAPDKRNDKYKEIVDYRVDTPTKVKVN